jgi:hypothetical protein
MNLGEKKQKQKRLRRNDRFPYIVNAHLVASLRLFSAPHQQKDITSDQVEISGIVRR